jgi:hypothetical protein
MFVKPGDSAGFKNLPLIDVEALLAFDAERNPVSFGERDSKGKKKHQNDSKKIVFFD